MVVAIVLAGLLFVRVSGVCSIWNDVTKLVCFNGATCAMSGCICSPDFTGADCSVPVCSIASPCQNGGTCTRAERPKAVCICPSGFSGSLCETDIDECASSPCANDGSCVDGVNAFTCECNNGYTGDLCTTKPCDSHPCGGDGVCAHIVLLNAISYLCTCPSGSVGFSCPDGTAVPPVSTADVVKIAPTSLAAASSTLPATSTLSSSTPSPTVTVAMVLRFTSTVATSTTKFTSTAVPTATITLPFAASTSPTRLLPATSTLSSSTPSPIVTTGTSLTSTSIGTRPTSSSTVTSTVATSITQSASTSTAAPTATITLPLAASTSSTQTVRAASTLSTSTVTTTVTTASSPTSTSDGTSPISTSGKMSTTTPPSARLPDANTTTVRVHVSTSRENFVTKLTVATTAAASSTLTTEGVQLAERSVAERSIVAATVGTILAVAVAGFLIAAIVHRRRREQGRRKVQDFATSELSVVQNMMTSGNVQLEKLRAPDAVTETIYYAAPTSSRPPTSPMLYAVPTHYTPAQPYEVPVEGGTYVCVSKSSQSNFYEPCETLPAYTAGDVYAVPLAGGGKAPHNVEYSTLGPHVVYGAPAKSATNSMPLYAVPASGKRPAAHDHESEL